MRLSRSVISTMLLCMVLAVVLAACAPKQMTYAYTTDTAWENINTENSGFANYNDFISEVDECFEQIGTFIYGDDWHDIFRERYGDEKVFFYFDKTISRAVSNKHVVLNQFFFENRIAPIAHEIAHIVLTSKNDTLREGFASFCQDEFGKNHAISNFGLDVHALARYYLTPAHAKIIENIGHCEWPEFGQVSMGDFRPAVYRTSHSFVNYLIETYGTDKFLELYKTIKTDADYAAVYGKEIAEIKADWLTFLQEYERPLTKDEIHNQLKQVFSHANMSEEEATRLAEAYMLID